MNHKPVKTEKKHTLSIFLKGGKERVKTKTAKPLALLLTLALLLSLLPATASAASGSVTPQIAYSTQENSAAGTVSGCILVLQSDGTLWQLSTIEIRSGTADPVRFTGSIPKRVQGEGGVGFLSDVIQIAGNSDGFFALKSDGSVWAWGLNKCGSLLGKGDVATAYPYPTRIPDGAGYLTGVTAISAGSNTSSQNPYVLALKGDKTVYSWGCGSLNIGQLGIGAITPSDPRFTNGVAPVTQVVGVGGTGYLSGVTAISAGGNGTSMALLSNGTVCTWGLNRGNLGNATETANVSYPVQVVGPGGTGTLSDIKAIAAGYDAMLALKDDGTLWSWGQNRYGTVGDGTTNNMGGNRIITPVQVSALGNNVTAIYAAGQYANMAVSGGKLYAFGTNMQGVLGDGTTTDHYTPQPVLDVGGGAGSTLDSIAGVAYCGTDALSKYFALALKSDGTVLYWGGIDGTRSYPARLPNNGADITVSTAMLTEQNLDGQTVTLTLLNNAWRDSLQPSDFTTPTGIGIANVDKISATTCTLTLLSTGNITTPKLDIGINPSATVYEGNTAISYPATLRTVTAKLTMTGGNTWKDPASLSPSDFTAAEGVTITEVTNVNSTLPASCTLKLSITGDITNIRLSIGINYLATTSEGQHPSFDLLLTDATATMTLPNNSWKTDTLTSSDFTLPGGYTVTGVTRDSSTGCTLALSNTSSNNQSSSVGIGVTSAILQYDMPLVSVPPITLYDESVVLTCPTAPFTEQNLDGAVLTVSLTGSLFRGNSLNKGLFTLNNAPAGVSIDSAASVSATVYRLTLFYDGSDFTGEISDFSVSVARSAVTNGGTLTTNSLTITGAAKPLIISPDIALSESNLNGRLLNVALGTGTFADTALDKANFTLQNAPDGLTVASVLYISPTRCIVGLSFDGSYFAVDYTRFHLVIAGAELNGGSALSSQNLPITAIGTGAGKYALTPVTSTAYTVTANGSGSTIASMTVTSAGFKYFTVNVSPLESHSGLERVVFVQLRSGAQIAVSAAAADFDTAGTAKAGFNVQTGDIIKVYIVDNTTGDADANPTLLQ